MKKDRDSEGDRKDREEYFSKIRDGIQKHMDEEVYEEIINTIRDLEKDLLRDYEGLSVGLGFEDERAKEMAINFLPGYVEQSKTKSVIKEVDDVSIAILTYNKREGKEEYREKEEDWEKFLL
ncbi:MAG: hypothetical protein SVV03_01890 [Candidatus Nanohaloarchaea archaeon]|nr:hypothetical protein [Candidatus Nanohaloarchaea archaeon]